MKTTAITKPSERLDPVEKFGHLVTIGIDAWVEAGRLLNEMVAKDEGARRKIMEAHPWVTLDVLLTFERIGKRELYPRLMLDCSPGARRLVRLPYETQEMYFAGLVRLAIWDGRKVIPVDKKLQHLSPAEAALVFTDTGVRTFEEQKERLAPKLVSRGAHQYAGPRDGDPVASTAEIDAPTESNSVDECLRVAQQLMIRARHLLDENKKFDELDGLITVSLTCIGKIRFTIGDND